MKTHEIVGPEVTQVTGQLRILNDIAISKHIAQFWNPPGWYKTPEPEKKPEENTKLTEKQRVTQALVETTIVMSDTLGINLRDVKSAISTEIMRREEEENKKNGYLGVGCSKRGKYNDI